VDEFKRVKARGSHSVAYFTQQISANDERMLCANAINPRNWYTCGGGNPSAAVADIEADCLSSDNNRTAFAEYQPLELLCINTQFGCTNTTGVSYYLIKIRPYGDDLSFIDVLLSSSNPAIASRVETYGPRPLDEFAGLFGPTPTDATRLLNKDDFCGYYFLPYDLIRESQARFNNFFVNDYKLSFSSRSFTRGQTDANADYTYLASSTKTQVPLPAAFQTEVYPNNVAPLSQSKNLLGKLGRRHP